MMTGPREGGLKRLDFASAAEVRWCPGCGDYAILNAVQTVLAGQGVPPEKYVFVSGIGCSSRFPYYMSTYGFHTVHGRAGTVATGIKLAAPDLSVWVVTGDGDALAIGAGHLMHLLRRNVDVKILLFNNQVYGLTKGQVSPTSVRGQRTPTTPWGSLDPPFKPLALALAAGGTFVARSVDRFTAHLQSVLERAARHRGTALVEIFQNCHIFNDGAFADLTGKEQREERPLFLEQGQPLVFGRDKRLGLRLGRGGDLAVAEAGPETLVHDEQDPAGTAARLAGLDGPGFPVPLGVFRAVDRPTLDGEIRRRKAAAAGEAPSLAGLLAGSNPWRAGDWGVDRKGHGG